MNASDKICDNIKEKILNRMLTKRQFDPMKEKTEIRPDIKIRM